MTRRLYRVGDCVRFLKPTLSGWQGEGFVIKDQAPDDRYVTLVKDGIDLDDLNGYASSCPSATLELIAVRTP